MPFSPLIRPAWQRLQRVGWIKRLADDLRLWRRYGTPRPEKLRLPHSQNILFADPRENRGRAVLLCGGAGQPRMKDIWRRAAAALRPTIVLDVGLNYGEFLFAECYPNAQRIVAIEANERLRPWIERSIAVHPDAARIEALFALAADKTDEASTLYVDPQWSGRSSAVLPASQPGWQQRKVRSITIDSLFADRSLADDRLLFKVDVEGYEPPVMRGMQRLTRECGQAFGFIEFNSRFIERQQVDVDAYLAELSARFAVFLLDRQGRAVRLSEPTLVALHGLVGPGDVETDLLLATSAELLDRMEIATNAHST